MVSLIEKCIFSSFVVVVLCFQIAAQSDSTVKSKLEFTSSDIKYLQTFVNKLKKFEVYDISEIEKILNKIDSQKSTVINEWKNKMKNALYITDENLFAELMKL